MSSFVRTWETQTIGAKLGESYKLVDVVHVYSICRACRNGIRIVVDPHDPVNYKVIEVEDSNLRSVVVNAQIIASISHLQEWEVEHLKGNHNFKIIVPNEST